MTKLKTSDDWSKINQDVVVLDPDGWDRANFDYSWHQELISEQEYNKRLSISTVYIKPKEY